jgi:hypothetical protein
MFGSSKAVVFDPYGRRRRRGVPSWFLWLLSGGVLGIGAVVAVQEKLLPPRLSAAESQSLRTSFEAADVERARLLKERDGVQEQLDKANAELLKSHEELGAAKSAAERARGQLSTLLAALPPDPRAAKSAIEVRVGRFTVRRGNLDYEVVLTRRQAARKPLAGVMQLVVAGASGGGRPVTIRAEPVSLSVDGHEIVSGSVPLPDDFTPRQTTVQVLDRPAGRSLGMRVLNVEAAGA